jgi:hypothetical protein
MISSLIAMSLIDAIGAANISSSVPKRGVMFLRRAMTTIMWCGAKPDASAFRQPRDIRRDPPGFILGNAFYLEIDSSAVLLVGFVRGRDDTASQRGFM